jgi:3D (Asp-Asp-Asp) domain-containing protein
MKAGFRHILMLVVFLAHMVSCAQTKVLEGETMTPSIYYKPTIQFDANKCAESDLKDMLSPTGKLLTTICVADFNRCLMEGSCFVGKEGRLRSFNYHSRVNGDPRFTEVDLGRCPYGYGVRNSCLDPYYTVAADLKVYKMGDVIFIPRLIGAEMPDGQTHDGFVIVRDAGAKIQGPNRFDFFTGFYNHLSTENTMARLGFGDPKSRFDFRLATEEEAVATRVRRGYPGVKNSIVVRGAGDSPALNSPSM